MRRLVFVAALLSLALALPGAAYAGVVAKINISTQRMQVYVNGKPAYNWRVSTARRGYRTPTGTYKPTNLVRYHRSTAALSHYLDARVTIRHPESGKGRIVIEFDDRNQLEDLLGKIAEITLDD